MVQKLILQKPILIHFIYYHVRCNSAILKHHLFISIQQQHNAIEKLVLLRPLLYSQINRVKAETNTINLHPTSTFSFFSFPHLSSFYHFCPISRTKQIRHLSFSIEYICCCCFSSCCVRRPIKEKFIVLACEHVAYVRLHVMSLS